MTENGHKSSEHRVDVVMQCKAMHDSVEMIVRIDDIRPGVDIVPQQSQRHDNDDGKNGNSDRFVIVDNVCSVLGSAPLVEGFLLLVRECS